MQPRVAETGTQIALLRPLERLSPSPPQAGPFLETSVQIPLIQTIFRVVSGVVEGVSMRRELFRSDL